MTKATMTPERLRAESLARVLLALDHIQSAQNELGSAMNALSALVGASAVHTTTRKLYDRVHSLWYQVDGFKQRGRYRLDDTNVDAILKREAEATLQDLNKPQGA